MIETLRIQSRHGDFGFYLDSLHLKLTKPTTILLNKGIKLFKWSHFFTDQGASSSPSLTRPSLRILLTATNLLMQRLGGHAC